MTLPYDQWMDETGTIARTYSATHDGADAAHTDVAHILYRRAFEQNRWPSLEHALAEWTGGTPGPTPQPTPGPTPGPLPSPRTGRVRLEGRALADDGGPWLALAASLFYAPRDVYEGNAEHLVGNARWLREHGCDAVRVLAETTDWVDISGRDRRTDPRWPNYRDVLRGTRDTLDACGLRTSWTIFGGNRLSEAEQDQCVADVLAVCVERPELVLDVEIANENNGHLNTGQYRRYAQAFLDAGFVVSLTSVEHDTTIYTSAHASWASYHFDRKRGDRDWRIVRQPWGTRGEYGDVLAGMPWRSGEPAGPGSSVENYTDPEIVGMQAVHTWLCGGGLHVVHHGSGIYGVDTHHPVGGPRPANVWDQPALGPTLDLIAQWRAQLPADLPNWTRTRHAMSDHPFDFPPDAAETVGDQALAAGRGCVRAYAAYRGDRFVCSPIGIMTSLVLAPRHADAPAPITLAEADGRSRILLGTYR